MFAKRTLLFALGAFFAQASALKVVLTNDDGWAVAQIRAEYDALLAAGFDVVLSAPSENQSGTGSSTAAPTVLNKTCEFNTCPVGSPPEGADKDDPFINYVNAFPVDSVRFGIQTLAPKLLGSAPDFVISGSNIGNNLGSTVLISGTVGAATEAALEGIPSFAFSGASGSQVSFTTLNDRSASSTTAANIYTDLVLKFVDTILDSPAPILRKGISVNVNFAATSNKCAAASNYSWVFTRINSDTKATDVNTCGTTHLPTESNAIKQGCIATVSVFNATTKGDVDAATQKSVLDKITPILTCI
ncbi:sure-like protein, partial [Pluteus cervinus]